MASQENSRATLDRFNPSGATYVVSAADSSWSSDGRYLLSASQDWRCIIWDLKDGSRVRTIRFEAAVFVAELHPGNPLLFAVALFEDQPVLVDASQDPPVKHLLPSTPKHESFEDETLKDGTNSNSKHATTVVCWSSAGTHVLAGTGTGWLNIIDSSTQQIVFSTRLANGILTALRLSRSGRNLLTNSSDRIIRTISLPDLDEKSTDFDSLHLEPEFKFQDIVNRLSWNNVTFSSTAEYVTASIYMNFHLYVWERGHGSLEKILEGPKEEMSSVEWHPHKPFLAATGIESGRVYLWSVNAPQRWSALAPDFMEVEENIEYAEREDEFDILPIDQVHQRILSGEDEDIDVLTIDPDKHGTAGDFTMPVLFDVEDSDSDDDLRATGSGQHRRKSPLGR